MATQRFSICFSGLLICSLSAPVVAAPGLASHAPHLRNIPHSKGLARFKRRVARQAARFPHHFFLEASKLTHALALTFDGGPDPRHTKRLLAVLARYKVKATFFLVGRRAARFRKSVKAIHRAGHAIGGHGYTHDNLAKQSMKSAWRQIRRTEDAIARAIGKRPAFYRPPYGAVSDRQIAYFGKRGVNTINWSVDSFDWDKRRNSVRQIIAEVLRLAHGGAIILLHGGSWRPNTLKALPALIKGLRKRGYTFETIPQLLGIPAFHE